MKEITGKQKKNSSSLPKAIKTKQRITENENETAKEFNKYFNSVGTCEQDSSSYQRYKWIFTSMQCFDGT